MSNKLHKTYWQTCLCGDTIVLNYSTTSLKPTIKKLIKMWDELHADHTAWDRKV